jgi:hypothetical protein
LAYNAVIFFLEVVHPVAVPITEGYFALFAIMCGIAVNSTSLAHPAWPLHSPLNKNMKADDSLIHIATVDHPMKYRHDI